MYLVKKRIKGWGKEAFFNEKKIKESLNQIVILECFKEKNESLSQENIIGLLKDLSPQKIKLCFEKSLTSPDSFSHLEWPLSLLFIATVFNKKGELLYYNPQLYRSLYQRIFSLYQTDQPLLSLLLR